jgi:phosphomannomutase
MKAFIFDVDGTLTPSRQRIVLEFEMFFRSFCERNEVYLVTGSDRHKTIEQISMETYLMAKRVYNCSGNDVWVGHKNLRTSSFNLPEQGVEYLNQCLQDSLFPYKTGQHFDARPGLTNFSILGRSPGLSRNVLERKEYVYWDSVENERNKICEEFNTMFPELEAKVGGETGIDISNRGEDKGQIINDFEGYETHFFGDAMNEGGNDLPLANLVDFKYHVTGWEDTQEKLELLIKKGIAK